MDSEQANDLKSSMLWASIVEEIDRFIFFEVAKLRTCTPEELPTIQSKLQCFESLKNLPDNVLDRENK